MCLEGHSARVAGSETNWIDVMGVSAVRGVLSSLWRLTSSQCLLQLHCKALYMYARKFNRIERKLLGRTSPSSVPASYVILQDVPTDTEQNTQCPLMPALPPGAEVPAAPLGRRSSSCRC